MLNKWFSKKSVIVSPADGWIKNLEEVDDETFSSKVMGDGFAIAPSSSNIHSPVNGFIDFVFKTKHAVGLKTSDGIEVLLHIGVDTVSLEGKGFTSHVESGDRVKQGDLLLSVDFDSFKDSVPSTDIIAVLTSGHKCSVKSPNTFVSSLDKNIIHIS